MTREYKSKRGGSIFYNGPTTNKDNTYNPDTLDDYVNRGLYQEAITYIDSYSYSNPSDYIQMQRLKEECKEGIAYKQRRYQLAGESNKQILDFIDKYDSDYKNLNDIADNKYANEYLREVKHLFDGEDEIELEFDKTKRKFIFDRLAPDNTQNNIHSYKQRLAKNLGYESISDNYLAANGITVVYGDEDGAAKVRVREDSPFLKEVLESVAIDRFRPQVYAINDKGARKKQTGSSDLEEILFRKFGKQTTSFGGLEKIHNIVQDARNLEEHISVNDDFVPESKNYTITLPDVDPKVNEYYEKQLIEALKLSLPDKQDIRVFTGPKEVLSFDENGLANRLDADKQKQLLTLATRDNAKFNVALNITNDGRVGVTFEVDGAEGSKNKKERERLLFTIYDWNVEAIQELIDNSPEYQAVIQTNKISRYNSTYESLDGNNYTYFGGGYGSNALYKDNNGYTVGFEDVKNAVMRDNLIKQQINNILVRTNTFNGKPIADIKDLTSDMDAAAITIAAQIIKTNPVNAKGEPLSIKDIQAFINLDSKQVEYARNNSVSGPSYDILNYIRDIKITLYNQLMQYYEQFNR